MNILIYCRDCDAYASLAGTIRRSAQWPDAPATFHTDDYDELRRNLVRCQYDLLIVAEKGAQGMEVCIGARKIKPHLALFWFSDDPAFAAQSYRLNCTYFGMLPVSDRVMVNAMERLEDMAPYQAWG